MTLRVLLLGAVTSLGLALPSGESLESWTHSGRAWMNARLAEWGVFDPGAETAFVLVAAPVEVAVAAELPAPNVAEAGADAVAQVPTPSAVEPPALADAVDDDLEAALAEWTEVVDSKAPVAAAAPANAEVKEVNEDGAGTTAWLIEKIAEWSRLTEVVESRFVLKADAIEIVPQPAVAAVPVPAPVAAAATTLAADPDRIFNEVVDEMAEAFTKDVASIAVAESRPAEAGTPAGPTFESPTVDDDLYPGMAYELNREAEGFDTLLPTPAPAPAAMVGVDEKPVATVPAPQKRWTHAIRLTREAVNAWANVLHGPAIVTIER